MPSDNPSTPEPRRISGRRRGYVLWFRRALIALGGLFVLSQLVPYGRAHENPPATVTVSWDSPRTEALVRAACFDCHSHETVWPWYSNVAPISWLVQNDVDEGREHLNFSTGNLHELEEAVEVVLEGEMPPWFYLPAHPEARLDAAEKRALLDGLRATFPGHVGPGDGEARSDHEGHEDDD